MSKALCAFPEHERPAVIARRLSSGSQGIGYAAALDAARKLKLPIPSQRGSFKPKRIKRREIEGLINLADAATI